MTALELLKTALALFFETETEDYADVAIPHINMVLAETFNVNNRIREFNEKEPLEEIPAITSLDDAIPYEGMLSRLALPYGLASKLYFDEEDNSRLSMFLEEYANRVNQCDKQVVVF